MMKRSEWIPFSIQYNIQYDNDNPLERSDDLNVLLFDYLYTRRKCCNLSQTLLAISSVHNAPLYPLGNKNQVLLLREGEFCYAGGHLFALLYLIPTTVILTEEHLLLHSSTFL